MHAAPLRRVARKSVAHLDGRGKFAGASLGLSTRAAV
jgi:hypothetical protein